MEDSVSKGERFPLSKLSRVLALKVVEKIPFGTFETQNDGVPESKWYPFLSFELCSRSTAELCSLLETRTYCAVQSLKHSDEDGQYDWCIEMFSPNETRRELTRDQAEKTNFAFEFAKLNFYDRPLDYYNFILTGLKHIKASAHDAYLCNTPFSAEDVCRIIEDFDVKVIRLVAHENLSHDFICADPRIQKLKLFGISGCGVNLTEEVFLNLPLDHFYIASIIGNLTSHSINQFLKQWNDGKRKVKEFSLNFETRFVFEEQFIIFEDLDFYCEAGEFLLRRPDGEILEINILPYYIYFKRRGADLV